METKNDKKASKNNADDEVKKNQEVSENAKKNEKKELSIEDKLKETENKLLNKKLKTLKLLNKEI